MRSLVGNIPLPKFHSNQHKPNKHIIEGNRVTGHGFTHGSGGRTPGVLIQTGSG